MPRRGSPPSPPLASHPGAPLARFLSPRRTGSPSPSRQTTSRVEALPPGVVLPRWKARRRPSKSGAWPRRRSGGARAPPWSGPRITSGGGRTWLLWPSCYRIAQSNGHRESQRRKQVQPDITIRNKYAICESTCSGVKIPPARQRKENGSKTHTTSKNTSGVASSRACGDTRLTAPLHRWKQPLSRLP